MPAFVLRLLQALFLIFLPAALTGILGYYIANLFRGKRTFMHPVLGWLEELCYKAGGVSAIREMTWLEYLRQLLLFNFFGFLAVFFLQLLQGFLPLNPQNFPAPSVALSFNVAASFTTNTNWQSYAGETTLSYLTQMLGLAVQNFLSASSGMAALLVLIRGFTRQNSSTIGNFWSDLIRTVIYLLLPLSFIWAIFLVGEGVIQNFSPYIEAAALENAKQILPMGPAASQIAIKVLGTNGGGFFNANSAHPFENPTAFSNFLQVFALVFIPAATVWAFGLITKQKNHALLLLFVMILFWAGGICLSVYSESLANPSLGVSPVLEGKEMRFGIFNSLLYTVSTTCTANGSCNAMISSLSPLAGGVALFDLMLGEIIFGGVGVGLCGMLMFVLLTVFLSGLMVGRTPEYLEKKIEVREMQWVIMSVLLPPGLILLGSGISSAIPQALSSLGNQGPHGLTEILYAFTSATQNNGSAFAGLNANTDYYNIFLGVCMLTGRLAILVPSIAVGGLLAKKKASPISKGTFLTDNFLFAFLLIAVILIVGVLTFFPALVLGPFVEHLLMLQGRTF